jgi:hypothetical protein
LTKKDIYRKLNIKSIVEGIGTFWGKGKDHTDVGAAEDTVELLPREKPRDS